jgi:hypothetical protein
LDVFVEVPLNWLLTILKNKELSENFSVGQFLNILYDNKEKCYTKKTAYLAFKWMMEQMIRTEAEWKVKRWTRGWEKRPF